jgi:GGDEF domain-containing protein
MSFSHDGLRDSLTRVAAPPYFYESLKREISLSERNESTITAVTFKLISEQAIDDSTLLTFVGIVRRTFPSEIHIARMGENVFVVLISGDAKVAVSTTAILNNQWKAESILEVSLYFAWACHKLGESSLDFLNRLDYQKLKSTDSKTKANRLLSLDR